MRDKRVVERLKPDEIRYLALEGGGGKGFAYLGAIEVLEKQLGGSGPVMSHIEGVAGTSAGAITALMLSMGMTAEEIAYELDHTDFNSFFDPPLNKDGKRRVPGAYAYLDRENSTLENLLLEGGVDNWSELLDFREVSGFGFNFSMLGVLLGGIPGAVRGFIAKKLEKSLAPLSVLLRGAPEVFVFFDRDMGLFSGEAARNFFDDLIRRRLQKAGVPVKREHMSLPFIMHKQIFGRDLLVCGANLSTGRSVLFSHKHTPNFPVADAVRISMSLPFIYKPYVIEKKIPGFPPCGTYVDGGVWNNLPFREIGVLGKQTRAKPRRSAAAADAHETVGDRSMEDVVESRNTLGLRLEYEPPQKVLTSGDMARKLLGFGVGMTGAGESQVIADLEPFTLLLHTEGLDLLEFSPNPETKKKVSARSRRAMYRYFGVEPPKEDADLMDELYVNAVMSKSACK